MSKAIKDIEKIHVLLVDIREIFKDFGKDTVVDMSRMQKACNRIDSLIGCKGEVGTANIDKNYWTN